MIEVRIPNNVSEYKPKFILGLTGRQFICVALTAVFILLDVKFLKPYIGDLFILVASVPAALAACFGWGENFTPGNVPFEKYLQSVLFQTILAPKNRTAKSDDSSVVPCDKNYVPIPDNVLAPEVLECVQQARAESGNVTTEGKPKKGKGKVSKPRYRKSKRAML